MRTIKTDATIKSLPVSSVRYVARDVEVGGLELRCSPDGAKRWSIRYRVAGVRRRAPLGSYPGVSLAEARKAALRVIVARDKGADPVADKRQAEAVAIAAEQARDKAARIERLNTVGSLIDRYLAFVSDPTRPRATRKKQGYKRSWKQDRGYLGHVRLSWATRPVTSITRADAEALVAAYRTTAPVAANRLAASLSALFRYAMDGEKLISGNPAARLVDVEFEADPADVSKAYTADELRRIITNCDAMPIGQAGAVMLQMMTGCRPTEASAAEWREFDGEWWTIPAARSKNGRAHRLYLTPTARKFLATVPTVEGVPFLFDGHRGKRQQREANAIIFAGVRERANPRHALRHAVAKGMADLGISIEHVAFVMNHTAEKLAVTTIYAGHVHDPQVRAALERWGVQLAAIRRGKAPAKVVSISA